jgi:parallel beta-helix repeat protein
MDAAWSPYKIVVAYNIAHDNFNAQSGSSNTDGNGIILDDWRHTQHPPHVSYLGGGLVLGNLTYRNGSKGIHAFLSENITIANNTAYGNNWDTHQTATWRAEISVQGGGGVEVYNNIAWAFPGPGILAFNVPFMGHHAIAPTNVWANNIAYGANNNFSGPDVFPTRANRAGTDPLFTDAAGGDFTLQPGSPAIGFGRSGLHFPPSPIDSGAYQSRLTDIAGASPASWPPGSALGAFAFFAVGRLSDEFGPGRPASDDPLVEALPNAGLASR